jgi:2-oxoglutarate ferredoxin oxidoreductase subunit gamma
VKNISDNFQHVYRVAATKTAEEKLGKALFANIVMLGALSGLTGLVDLSSLEKSLEGNVPPTTTAINKQALALGYAIAETLKKP